MQEPTGLGFVNYTISYHLFLPLYLHRTSLLRFDHEQYIRHTGIVFCGEKYSSSTGHRSDVSCLGGGSDLGVITEDLLDVNVAA